MFAIRVVQMSQNRQVCNIQQVLVALQTREEDAGSLQLRCVRGNSSRANAGGQPTSNMDKSEADCLTLGDMRKGAMAMTPLMWTLSAAL